MQDEEGHPEPAAGGRVRGLPGDLPERLLLQVEER